MRLPVLYCAKCHRGEPTTVCRWCSHDKLADLCAAAAKKIAGDPLPVLEAKAPIPICRKCGNQHYPDSPCINARAAA